LNLVIGFGLHLRDSEFKGDLTPALLRAQAQRFNAKTEEERELKQTILALLDERNENFNRLRE
jgi:hypothetical protein